MILLIIPGLRMVAIAALCSLLPLAAKGMSDAYGKGGNLAHELPIPQPSSPESIPGYGGADVSVSKVHPKDMGEASLNAAKDNEGSKLLTEVFEKKEKYVIDPLNDPLIKAGNKVVQDPQKTLDEEMIEVEGTGEKDELHVCEETGEEYVQKCTKHLEVTLKIIPEVRANYRYCSGAHRGWGGWWNTFDNCMGVCGGCSIYSAVVSPEKVEVEKEEWIDGCIALEELAEKGLCRYVDKVTSQKDETRTIQNKPITRDHWEEYYEYGCLKPPSEGNSCKSLRSKGCYQVKSFCKETIGDACVLWEATYRCPSGKKWGKSYRPSNKNNPFCLSGDCADPSYQANGDFANVMSQLSVLKQAGDDLRNFGIIFKGQDWRCTRNCINFRDCCGNGKGWGVSLGLSSCDETEKTLADLRKKNRCIEVGTYCAERLPITKICLRKKTTFCCYDTKLAKIVQEQGKRQIGGGFGSPEHPQCQGLTMEQLSQLDFARIDFSELFSDITANTKVPNTQNLTQDIQKSMEHRGNLLKIQEKGVKDVPLPKQPINKDQEISQNNPVKEPSTMNVQGRGNGEF